MPLDLWFREDVTRILAATYETLRASARARHGGSWPVPEPDPQALSYQQGFADALRAVAIAFGVATPAPADPPRQGGFPGPRFSGYQARLPSRGDRP